jgi:hypothetical protein
MPTTIIEQRLRRAMLALAGGIFLGTPVELWLNEHTKERLQYIPFVLCGLGVLAVVGVVFSPTPITLWFLRGSMVLATVGSLLGMYEHLAGNFAFELEIRPNATHQEVVMDALHGANPLLAPGVLAIAAIIALIATYHHPGFKQIRMP